jgi:hypothetical protein
VTTGYLGRLQTRNYEFTTYQKTVQEVRDVLRSMWDTHKNQYPEYEQINMYVWEFLEDSVTITPLSLGDTKTDCERCENLAHN